MDSIARVIRSSIGHAGKSSSVVGAPLVVLEDDGYDTVGGDVVFRRILDRLVSLHDDDFAAAVCVENPPDVYMESSSKTNRQCIVIDCFTNPCGLSMVKKKVDRQYAWMGGDSLEKLEETIQESFVVYDSCSAVVGIDGMSCFVKHFGPRPVAHFLSRLRRHPRVRCVVIYLHADIHEESPQDLAMVSQDVLCHVQLVPGWGLALDQSRPGDSIGKLILRVKKTQGCKKTEVFEYWMDGEEGLRMESRGERQKTSQASEPASVTSVSQQMQSNMKLELSEEERRAKTNVVLPYEHQGHQDAYQTNDYRDYLPAEAGGHGPSGHLGHIVYIRDSDSDGEYDSDEDPDDDLDI